MLHWQKRTIVQPSCNFGPPVNSLANLPSGSLPPLMKKPYYQQLLPTLLTSFIASRTDQSQIGPLMFILTFIRSRLVLPLPLHRCTNHRHPNRAKLLWGLLLGRWLPRSALRAIHWVHFSNSNVGTCFALALLLGLTGLFLVQIVQNFPPSWRSWTLWSRRS